MKLFFFCFFFFLALSLVHSTWGYEEKDTFKAKVLTTGSGHLGKGDGRETRNSGAHSALRDLAEDGSASAPKEVLRPLRSTTERSEEEAELLRVLQKKHQNELELVPSKRGCGTLPEVREDAHLKLQQETRAVGQCA